MIERSFRPLSFLDSSYVVYRLLEYPLGVNVMSNPVNPSLQEVWRPDAPQPRDELTVRTYLFHPYSLSTRKEVVLLRVIVVVV